MTDIDHLCKPIMDSLKQAGLGNVVFDSGDAPKVMDVLREKAILEYATRAESENREITQAELEEIEQKVLLFDPHICLEKAETEASEIARSIMATIILSDMLDTQLKLGIDAGDKKHDNKVVDSVTNRLIESYPTLMTAAESAGQQILEKYLDEGAKNVQDS
jgi:uncharacterized protein (DUF849 family)